MEYLCVRKTIYFLVHFVGIFLEKDLTPMDAWTRLHGDIVEGDQDVDCQTIIDWI